MSAKKKTFGRVKSTIKKTGKSSSRKVLTVTQRMTKSQVMIHLAQLSELSKKEVTSVFEALQQLAHAHLRKGGAGEFIIPGLMKCVVKRKPATKSRMGINPFTGKEMMFKA